MKKMNRSKLQGLFKLTTLGAAIVSLGLAGNCTGNEVTFIDGGYAELCSALAHNADDATTVALTGSRLGIPAVDICTRALEDETHTPQMQAGIFNNRGVLLFKQGRLEEALSDFGQALRVQDLLAAAHINLGYTLVALQRWADSIPAFDKGIALGPPDPAKAHFNRGIAHDELGHVREAYQDYLKAAELDPTWAEPKQELGRFSVR
jgi:tetratricopeptide (TPR) repeat protein